MKYLLLAITLLFACSAGAQTNYSIDINLPEKEILRDHLDLGGKNPSGEALSVNSYYIEKDGKPFFPVVGEFHFSRYPEAYWEESILKMKAGGINVIASYVFWNLHERVEGQFDWSGNLNLKKFVELIGKHNLYAIVRLGPFCHGEMRNGGIPDWLYGRPFEIRSNDPGYLEYVDKLYAQIGKQINGLAYKDGGPVIGVQLENEYQHSAAPWEWAYPGTNKEFTVAQMDAALAHEQIAVTDGKNPWLEYGKQHMKRLKALALKNGIEVPLYTATGWGNATIVEKGSLPVTAGYAYPFWMEPAPSSFYLFKDIHQHPDYSPVSFDTSLYPSIPAEIGPGIQVKHSRRPFVPYESVNPLMVRIVGSGSNGIGYYMYHGGSTPVFEGKFYNEEANGIPRINYDFQAPIGQYGQVRYHFKHLRQLHLFLDSWGATLAPMKTVLPSTNAAITPENTHTLRYAVRSYGNAGFVFMINFQDYLETTDIKNVNIAVKTADETISFPFSGGFNVVKGSSAILPFNMNMAGTLLKSATVQPLTILRHSPADYYVFSSIQGMDAEMVFPSSTRITRLNNAKMSSVHGVKKIVSDGGEPFSFTADGVNVLVLPPQMALNATKIDEYLFISDALILDTPAGLQYISRKTESRVDVFPAIKANPLASEAQLEIIKKPVRGFASYNIRFQKVEPCVTVQKISDQKYTVKLNSDFKGLHDLFLETDYTGDRAMAFIDGKMITDHFFHERIWEIGLRNIAPDLKNKEIVLLFHPVYSSYSYLKDLKRNLEFVDNKYLKVTTINVVPEYSTILKNLN